MILERTISILLFTSYLSRDLDVKNKPLSISEWNRFVRWLRIKKINPEDFLNQELNDLIEGYHDKSITKSRLTALINRKPALALALDKWSSAGVWVINRSESIYPNNLKEKLKDDAPPILFGIGNKESLHKKYIGVVGARDITEDELQLTKKIGINICNQKYNVVSGGAKGVDQSAMMGALEIGGNSIGILADSMIKKSTSPSYRNYIINGSLILISPFNPEAGFNVGNAMARNKLIYALSEATIVVKSNKKGGTWEGARENITQKWVPLWVVKPNENLARTGNMALVKSGARWLTPDFKIEELIKGEINNPENNIDLFNNSEKIKHISNYKRTEQKVTIEEDTESLKDLSSGGNNLSGKNISFFDLFLFKLRENFGNKQFRKDEIKECIKVTSNQLDLWLKEGVKKGLIIKKNRPVSYRIKSHTQIEIFH